MLYSTAAPKATNEWCLRACHRPPGNPSPSPQEWHDPYMYTSTRQEYISTSVQGGVPFQVQLHLSNGTLSAPRPLSP